MSALYVPWCEKALYKYSSFPFLSFPRYGPCCLRTCPQRVNAPPSSMIVVSPCMSSDALDASPRTVAAYSATSSSPVTSRTTRRWTVASMTTSNLWSGSSGLPAFDHCTLTFGRDSSHSNVAVPGSSVTTAFARWRTNSIVSSAPATTTRNRGCPREQNFFVRCVCGPSFVCQ